ncbi:MAG TPA: hypothetical protein VJB66_03350 [Candidatus Nanoarchaeia archaeon]|nr:hypothetical protein [Candidatus Nanoarchaeia archaeon]
MSKLGKIFRSWRVLLLLFFLVCAIIAIRPSPGNDGVVIRSVLDNSSAALAGIQSPKPSGPLGYEHITSIDDSEIETLEDYVRATESLQPGNTVRIVTDTAAYVLDVPNIGINETVNLGLKVAPAATSNLRKGLDIAGGSRVLLKPQEEVTDQDMIIIIESLTQRLNVYGLSDVVIRDATDLSGAQFISIEIAGVTEDEVRDVVARQGKFEAKISNDTVFVGGNKDVSYVCRTAECSGLDPQRGCGQIDSETWSCGFFFSISLSPEAAQRQAEATKKLSVVAEGGQRYLDHPLELYLDDKLVDTLNIAADLKGQAATSIQISGAGAGRTQQEAAQDALDGMKRLQTILITGSLPVKLSIEKMDTISPLLGEQFLRNIVLVGFISLAAIGLVVVLRYRTPKVVVPMMLMLVAEVILTLGFAAVVGWNLDIASMAGIIITIGTAVDHLIVITDETLRGAGSDDWNKKMKFAMFIVFGAYATDFAGMIPLWFAGAGLLKGFAFTSIVGISFGVIIARPAYAAILKLLYEE